MSQSNSYVNFNFDERQNNYKYSKSIAIYEKIEYNNQLFYLTQFFINF